MRRLCLVLSEPEHTRSADALALRVRPEAQMIVNVANAWDVLNHILGRVLGFTAVHEAGERHLAVLHLALDIGRVDQPG